ncbi:ZIP_zinc transporter protein [Hexamita inflata]|uniref:ZIP zinc transporter protein n=1 Tax=Hexamita inflata TaxID=28002 RepID=A0AA86UDX2_9EUKA|nr:ZIP zinc transporter protein [Hexamita inflata]
MIEKRVLILQLVAFFANIAVGVVGIALPYLFSNNKNVEKIMSYMNCAAGGVLGGVSIIHILPETGEVLNKLVNDFPLSFYITFGGLFVMVTLVKLGGHSHGDHETEIDSIIVKEDSVQQDSLENQTNSELLEQAVLLKKHEHHHEESLKPKNIGSVVMLLVGLMIHDVSEGISLGLCTTFDDTFQMFMAIFLHKWCEQVCQAICGIREGLSFKQNMAFLVPLCMATPIAQITAFFIIYFTTGSGELPLTALVVQDCFMSFAAGTFIGIMFEEVIAVEMTESNNKKSLIFKLLTFLLGFALISSVSIYEWASNK